MNSRIFSIIALFAIATNLSAKTVFVSSSMGNDANIGVSVDRPLKTINKALTIADTLLLKSGDVFYGSFTANDKYIDRYGEGNRPVVCGYKRIIEPNWEHVEGYVWRLKLTDSNFIGIQTPQSSTLNNIGCIHDWKNDKVHGRKMQYRKDLKQDWDFWQSEEFASQKVAPTEFDTLYMYCSKNPNKMQLELSTGSNGIVASGTALNNITIVGFGKHGIAGGTRTIIRNCRIDAIGGSTQLGHKTFASLGNGIEYYISKDKENCVVKGCYITRCYDCGITIQGSDKGKATPRNFLIEDNLVTNCCQGWEDFLRNDDDVVYENCVVRNNLFIDNGETSGFAYPESRFKYCQVLGNNFKGDKGLVLENNIFVNGNYYCTMPYQKKYMSHVWKNNHCYIMRGDFLLSNYTGTADVIRVPVEKKDYYSLSEATETAINQYRDKTGDKTTAFHILGRYRMKITAKLMKRRWLRDRDYSD